MDDELPKKIIFEMERTLTRGVKNDILQIVELANRLVKVCGEEFRIRNSEDADMIEAYALSIKHSAENLHEIAGGLQWLENRKPLIGGIASPRTFYGYQDARTEND